MHLECLEKEQFFRFQCKTDDMKSFECECKFYNALHRKISVLSYPNLKYFQKWFSREDLTPRIYGEWRELDIPPPHTYNT